MKTVRWIFWLAVGMAPGLADGVGAAEKTREDSLLHWARSYAVEARKRGDYDEALKNYQQYFEIYQKHFKGTDKDPEAQKAYYFAGKIYLEKNDLPAARQAFFQALALDSLHVNSNRLLFQIYQDSQPDSAAQCLERVVRARPKNVNYRRELAEFYRRQRQTRAALRHYTWIARAGKGDDQLFRLLAELYEELGEVDQALSWRQRLLAAQQAAGDSTRAGPGDEKENLESMLSLRRQQGDVPGAFEILLQLVEVDAPNRYSYYSQIVELAEETDDRDMRLRGLKGMVQADPADLESLATLVEVYLREDDRAATRQWLERGLREDAANAHLQLLRGDLLVLDGAEEEAIAAFEQARADPAWAQIAQQRIWNLRPPETREEQLKREFFGKKEDDEE